MLIVRIIVSCIQVTTDTLEIQLFFVIIVIEVGSNPFIRNTFRINIDMASLARFIIHNLLGIFQFALAVPINIFFILGQIRPDIFHSGLHFCCRMLQGTLWRKVTSRTISLRTALAVIVYGLLPSHVRIRVIMTRHTRIIQGTFFPEPIECNQQRESKYNDRQSS